MRCSMRSKVVTKAIMYADVESNPKSAVITNLDKAILTISEQITTLQLYIVRRLDELDEGLATLQQGQDELAKAIEELADEVLTERRRWEEE